MDKKIQPLGADEIMAKKNEMIPDIVFACFNELIIKEFNGWRAIIRQDDVVALIEQNGIDHRALFDNHWLDVEDSYRKAGWEVVYDRPAYCESYPATFSFIKPR